MKHRRFTNVRNSSLAALSLMSAAILSYGCGTGSDEPEGEDASAAPVDENGDGVADALGTVIDEDGDGLGDPYDVDGDGTDFAIVFERPESSTSQLKDIWCWGVSVPAAANQPIRTRAGPRPLAATAGRDERQPTITFAGVRYIAAWSAKQPNSTLDYIVYANNLSLNDCLLCGSRFQHGDPRARLNAWPAFASAWSGGATSSDGASAKLWSAVTRRPFAQRTLPPFSLMVTTRPSSRTL